MTIESGGGGGKEGRVLRVGASNFISQLFFLWLFPFIYAIRNSRNDIQKELRLKLRKSETTSYNDELLDRNWRAEKELAEKHKRFLFIFDLTLSRTIGALLFFFHFNFRLKSFYI